MLKEVFRTICFKTKTIQSPNPLQKIIFSLFHLQDTKQVSRGRPIFVITDLRRKGWNVGPEKKKWVF